MKNNTNQQLMTNWRWWMVVLLFVATTVNYMDRQVLSLTWKEFIAPEFHWTDSDYGTITAVFSLFYAFAMLFAGKFVDWMGTKKGYLWAIGIWSFGACAHALCGWATMHINGYETVEAMMAVEKGTAAALAISSVSVWLFLAARAVLALGEAGNFPAAIKTTAEYFPKKDRAFATSIFNAGASVGALVAPATIPPLAAWLGWEMAFVIIGALGFIWMGFWTFMYDKPEKSSHVNEAELAYIQQDEEVILPELHIGDKMTAKSISAECKFTSAPSRYSEATLVKKLEELGIGRPSTYVPTISTLTKGRGYITKGDKEGIKTEVTNLTLKSGKITPSKKIETVGAEKGRLLPQEIGMIVTDYLVNNFDTVLDYRFTANVEEDFDEIAEGNQEWNSMISNFYEPFHKQVDEILHNGDTYA